MSQQSVEFSDDDDENNACSESGPSLVATHGKGAAHFTEAHGGKTANVSRRKIEFHTERPNETGKVQERCESEIQRENVYLHAQKNDEKLGNMSDFSKVQNSQAADDKVSRKESLRDALPLIIAVIAIAVAFYTQFISIPYSQPGRPLNINPEYFPQPQEFIEEFSKRLSSVESSLQDIKQITARIEGFEDSLKNLKSDIEKNMFDKGSLIVVIMINTTLLVLVIIYLLANRDTNKHVHRNIDIEQQQVNGGVNQNPAPYSTARRILSQVGANPRLERKLCIISFYEETHPLHVRMTQSVTRQLNLESVEFIIRRHEDILKIPPVSLYFLFVDFNERNVILEDPTLGLGDLRLTTVQAVQKMGGRLVIFYVRDQNSRKLDSTTLYNEDLASVTRQRELSALNRLSRFISAYDQLTDFQKEHLRRIVVDELNGC